MDSQERYLYEKIADSLIHHKISEFGKSSYPSKLPDERLIYGRVICFFIILIAFVL